MGAVASNVGSEGIDLHTYTVRIIHYDLRMESRKDGAARRVVATGRARAAGGETGNPLLPGSPNLRRADVPPTRGPRAAAWRDTRKTGRKTGNQARRCGTECALLTASELRVCVST